MTPPVRTDGQSKVTAYFDQETSFWNDIYRGADVYSVIHQYRRHLTLAWIDDLGLKPGASVLEIGCGAGLTAVALAQRSFDVDAVDAAPAMIELARRNAQRAGVEPTLRIHVGDVHALDFPDGAFELVIALGVIPWLVAPTAALEEIARVLKPGGTFVGNADNAARLNRMLDPRLNPRLATVRTAAKGALRRLGVRFPETTEGVPLTKHSLAEFDRLLSAVGLEPLKGRTLGFGPFTLLGRPVLRGRRAVTVHRRLQALADRGLPGLRSVGSQYLVLARKGGAETVGRPG